MLDLPIPFIAKAASPDAADLQGKPSADELFARLYEELKRMAIGRFRLQPAHTLQATALVHEAYLRVHERELTYLGDGAFSVFACKAMRSVLVDHSRARQASKRQPDGQRLFLDDLEESYSRDGLDLVELDEVLRKLEEVDPLCSRVVELRYFGGMSVVETARVLSIGEDAVRRHWKCAGTWLAHSLGRLEVLDAGRRH